MSWNYDLSEHWGKNHKLYSRSIAHKRKQMLQVTSEREQFWISLGGEKSKRTNQQLRARSVKENLPLNTLTCNNDHFVLETRHLSNGGAEV